MLRKHRRLPERSPSGPGQRLAGFFYFDMLQFGRVAELFDEHFLFDISKRDLERKRNLSQLCLRNVVPAAFIRPRLTAARSTVLFFRHPEPSALLRRFAGNTDEYGLD